MVILRQSRQLVLGVPRCAVKCLGIIKRTIFCLLVCCRMSMHLGMYSFIPKILIDSVINVTVRGTSRQLSTRFTEHVCYRLRSTTELSQKSGVSVGVTSS